MDPNLHCRTRAHFVWWGTPECLKTTEGKNPKPTKNETRKTMSVQLLGGPKVVWTLQASPHQHHVSACRRAQQQPARSYDGLPKRTKSERQEENQVSAGRSSLPLGCRRRTGSVTVSFAFPWPPHARCCPS